MTENENERHSSSKESAQTLCEKSNEIRAPSEIMFMSNERRCEGEKERKIDRENKIGTTAAVEKKNKIMSRIH